MNLGAAPSLPCECRFTALHVLCILRELFSFDMIMMRLFAKGEGHMRSRNDKTNHHTNTNDAISGKQLRYPTTEIYYM
ncbi:hypothetical protein E2C01_084076 [Portunus trituberculatus]|uniref:Uncharacterized protein n=1 Tax=Portunus trituberculatus TaxID=210409 RepID=A0A5B7J3X2_PORTR|nr:hypothetical protein [Portunus trituberculatus]